MTKFNYREQRRPACPPCRRWQPYLQVSTGSFDVWIGDAVVIEGQGASAAGTLKNDGGGSALAVDVEVKC